jgi:hypothetical protein
MSRIVSKILDKCNSEVKPLNILIHAFDIETEIEISKTGHNFYRVIKEEGRVEDLPENFFILPPQQILFCFDYDMILFKNKTVDNGFVSEISQALKVPILIIDEKATNDMNESYAVTNMSNSKEKDFVENWKKLLDEFKEVYLT